MKRNNKILFNNILASFLIKGCSVFIGLLTMPAFISYFNNDTVLGIWYTILSILNWIMMFDLGIGNGLRNRLAKSLVTHNQDEQRRQISSAYIILGVLTIALLGLGELFIFHSNWNKILNVNSSDIANHILVISISIVYGGVLLQFWLKLATSILLAMRKNALSNMLLIVTNILIILFLYLCPNEYSIEEKLIILSVIYVIAINIPLVIASIYLFFGKLQNAIPRFRYYSSLEAKKVLNLGGAFFIIQLALLIINSTNEWLITFLYNAEYVVEYQIYYRIFNLILVLYSLITQPIWSSITIEYERNNFKWIKKAYKYLIISVLISAFVIIGVIFQFSNIVQIWLGTNSGTNVEMALTFGLFTLEMIWINCSTCVANGISQLKCQLVCFLLAAILKFPLSFWAVSLNAGWISIVVINVLVLIPMAILQPVMLKCFFLKIERNRCLLMEK